MKVLIAEDNAVYRVMLEKNLKKWGYDVVVAEDGERAWEILQQDDAPRLVILDWQMPGLDGIDVCRKVKQSEDLPFTYVIMFTGRDAKEDMVVGLDAGADDYLTKPVEPIVLRSRLSAAGRIVQVVPPKEWTAPIVEGFDVKQMIGKGAFATVWEALQKSTGQSVALKIIRVDLASDEVFDRFAREIQLMKEMDHPYIAKVYDSHLDHKLGYSAIELIDGWTLDKYVKQQKPKPLRLLYLINQVCEAMDHAHRRGIVHRDLKPTNIMVARDGTPKLVDFGLGKSIFCPHKDTESRADESMDGSVIGTPMFMAPEQARGENDRIDGRTDIYSLGIILFILLVRRHPHDITNKDKWKTVRQIAENEARLPSDLVPGFDADLEQVVMKALAREPEKRYQTAGDFALAIRNFIQDRRNRKKSSGAGSKR